jgi:hypothetical protein
MGFEPYEGARLKKLSNETVNRLLSILISIEVTSILFS